MLILQVIFLTLCLLPQAMHQFDLTFTIQVVKDPLRLAIENLIVNFNVCTYSYAMSLSIGHIFSLQLFLDN